MSLNLGPNMDMLTEWQNWLFVAVVLLFMFFIFHCVATRD